MVSGLKKETIANLSNPYRHIKTVYYVFCNHLKHLNNITSNSNIKGRSIVETLNRCLKNDEKSKYSPLCH